MVRGRLFTAAVEREWLSRRRWLEWFMWYWFQLETSVLARIWFHSDIVWHTVDYIQQYLWTCLCTQVSIHTQMSVWRQHLGVNDIPTAASIPSAQTLVSNTLLQGKEPGWLLKKRLILKLGQKIYKTSLQHLLVPGSTWEMHRESKWKKPQWPNLEQF